MAEYGVVCPEIFKYDYHRITNKILTFISEYDVDKIKAIVGQNFGIHPFDLFVLQKFIEENGINSIVEFGCGSSSKFLDGIDIKRTSFAIESIFYNVDFVKMDILDSQGIIEDFIKNNKFDMFLIDSDHTEIMAKTIFENFLNLTNHTKPIFIHDWFDNGKTTYTEQLFYLENMLSFYNVEYITDLPEEYIDTLTNLNNQMNIVVTNIPRCSIVLNPNKIR